MPLICQFGLMFFLKKCQSQGSADKPKPFAQMLH